MALPPENKTEPQKHKITSIRDKVHEELKKHLALKTQPEDVFFTGNQGKMQLRVHNSRGPRRGIALILPGDPKEYMGSIDNPIVQLLESELSSYGFTTVMMNYRGVGKSSGEFNSEREIVNVTFLVDWALNVYSNVELWVCGFSYGAALAMEIMMRRPEVTRFIAIGCAKYDSSLLSPCPTSGLIIHGTPDSVTPVAVLKELAMTSSKQQRNTIKVKYIENADSQFRGKEAELSQTISEYIEEFIAEGLEQSKMKNVLDMGRPG